MLSQACPIREALHGATASSAPAMYTAPGVCGVVETACLPHTPASTTAAGASRTSSTGRTWRPGEAECRDGPLVSSNAKPVLRAVSLICRMCCVLPCPASFLATFCTNCPQVHSAYGGRQSRLPRAAQQRQVHRNRRPAQRLVSGALATSGRCLK